MVYRGGRKANNMSYIVYKLPNGQLLADWCRENKIPYGTVRGYIDKGYTVENACIAGKKAREKSLAKPVIMYNGKSLRSQYPCGYNSIMTHMREKKCTIEEAIALYHYNLKHPYVPDNRIPVEDIATGKQYKSILDCARDLGVSATTIRKRIKKGAIKWILKKD